MPDALAEGGRLRTGLAALMAEVGRDAAIARLRAAADIGPAARAYAMSGLFPAVAAYPPTRDAARAAALLAAIDGDDSALTDESLGRRTVDFLARVLRSHASPAWAAGNTVGWIAATRTRATNAMTLLEAEGRQAAGGDAMRAVRTLGETIERRGQWLALLDELEGAEAAYRGEFARLVGDAIEAAGGVDAVTAGLLAVREGREPIARDARVAALVGRLSMAEAVPADATAEAVPAGWGGSSPAEDAGSIRKELADLRDGIVAARRSEARELAGGAARGDSGAVDRLIASLDGVEAAQAKALRSALDDARRSALDVLAAPLLAALRAEEVAAEEARRRQGAVIMPAEAPAPAAEAPAGVLSFPKSSREPASALVRRPAAEPATSAPSGVAVASSSPLGGRPAYRPLPRLDIAPPAPSGITLAAESHKAAAPPAPASPPRPVDRASVNHWVAKGFPRDQAEAAARHFTDCPRSNHEPRIMPAAEWAKITGHRLGQRLPG